LGLEVRGRLSSPFKAHEQLCGFGSLIFLCFLMVLGHLISFSNYCPYFWYEKSSEIMLLMC